MRPPRRELDANARVSRSRGSRMCGSRSETSRVTARLDATIARVAVAGMPRAMTRLDAGDAAQRRRRRQVIAQTETSETSAPTTERFRDCGRDRYARSGTRRNGHLGDDDGWIRRCGRLSLRGTHDAVASDTAATISGLHPSRHAADAAELRGRRRGTQLMTRARQHQTGLTTSAAAPLGAIAISVTMAADFADAAPGYDEPEPCARN